MECQTTFKMIIISEHLCALCINIIESARRPDTKRGYRHDSERGYQCGRVRWGRAVTQWARSVSLAIHTPSLCLINTRYTLLNMLLGRELMLNPFRTSNLDKSRKSITKLIKCVIKIEMLPVHNYHALYFVLLCT